MQSWKTKNEPFCQLPQREIAASESTCSKTYPIIEIAQEISNAPRSCNTVSFANIHKNEYGDFHPKKLRLFFARFFDRNYSRFENLNLFPRWLNIIPKVLLQLKRIVLPQRLDVDHIADYVETREWSMSSVRCMAWHSHVFKLAIACSDDVIRVYNEEGLQSPIIKHKVQKLVTCLAWRPLAIDEIAVGCTAGVVFWFTDSPRAQTMYAKILSYQNHFPVTGLEWRKDGLLLATISVNDSNVLLWNVDTGKCTPLRRFRPKCCFIRWAPQTSNLFCATIERVFRVWNIKNVCSVERWSLNTGRIQSAAWSPCGQILLFVTNDDTKLYRLQQIGNSHFLKVRKDWKAILIANLKPICVGSAVIGGVAQSIVWDQRGAFVAVTFKQTSCVAIFLTKIIGEGFCITPHGYIYRSDEIYPAYVCFQNSKALNENAILTIAWSNGSVEFCLLVEA